MFEPAPARLFARSTYYPWLVVGTVCIGTFIGQVDGSIVQLALPSLETAFGAPLDAVSWVALGYMLAFASVLPVFARMAEIAGRKTLYLAGFALFGLWSALCGLAPSLPVLIGFRVLQGMSGALLGANSVVILVTVAGPARRGQALGIMSAAQAVGLSIGPALGGVLLGALGWRWIFWVTVPFAILGTLLGWLIVPRTTTFSGDRRFDLPGAILLVPALATLLLVISEFQAWGLSAPLIACAVAAPLLLGGFIWREARAPAPLINLSLFRSAAFSAGSVGVLVSYGMLYGMFFAMSFALVRGYHDQPLAAGLRLTIVPVALGLVAPFSGALSDKRPRLLMLFGMAISAAAAIALTRLLDGTPGRPDGRHGRARRVRRGARPLYRAQQQFDDERCARRQVGRCGRTAQSFARFRRGRRRRRILGGARLGTRIRVRHPRADRQRARGCAPGCGRRRAPPARALRGAGRGAGGHSQCPQRGRAQGRRRRRDEAGGALKPS
jgi:EmrB/QacA subfamily drug resistance transporter